MWTICINWYGISTKNKKKNLKKDKMKMLEITHTALEIKNFFGRSSNKMVMVEERIRELEESSTEIIQCLGKKAEKKFKNCGTISNKLVTSVPKEERT